MPFDLLLLGYSSRHTNTPAALRKLVKEVSTRTFTDHRSIMVNYVILGGFGGWRLKEAVDVQFG